MIRALMMTIIVLCSIGWIVPAISIAEDGAKAMPLRSMDRIYGFTHFIGQAKGYSSEHSWTTDVIPEIKVDKEKKARVANNKEEDEKWEKDGNPYGFYRIGGWDVVCTYIDCPICGKKMYIDVDSEKLNKIDGE